MNEHSLFARCAPVLFVSLGALAAGCSTASPTPVPGDAGTPVVLDAAVTDASLPSDAGDPGPLPDGSGAPDAADGAAPFTQIKYTNPVLDQDFPDPFVLPVDGGYLAFATNANGKNVQTAQSADLASWQILPDALPTLPSWAAKNQGLTWAPSVLPRGAGYVLYYTARDVASGFQCISRATSANPAGPYTDSSSSPFVCQVSGSESLCGSIDPSPFVDTDGTAYLIWKSDENASQCHSPPRLWSAPLASDGLSLAGAHTVILSMTEAWEQPIIEGPSMAVIGGTYYLVYSANAYESAAYSMGYATCLSAMGPCLKRTVSGPFVKSAGTASGPGGGELFTDGDGRRWLAYHAWTAPLTTYGGGGARSLRIDPVDVDGGALSLRGPSTTAQMVP